MATVCGRGGVDRETGRGGRVDLVREEGSGLPTCRRSVIDTAEIGVSITVLNIVCI